VAAQPKARVKPSRELPAGWYPEHCDPRLLRYWSGSTWTQFVAPRPSSPRWPLPPTARSRWWQRAVSRGWRRRLLVVLSVLWVGGCVTMVPYLELSPGDYYAAPVVNDTDQTVRILDCINDPCTRRNSDDVIIIEPHARRALQADTRGGTRFTVVDASTGRRLGCLDPPSSASGLIVSPSPVRIATPRSCSEPVHYPATPPLLVIGFVVALTSFIAMAVLIASNLYRTRGRRHRSLAPATR